MALMVMKKMKNLLRHLLKFCDQFKYVKKTNYKLILLPVYFWLTAITQMWTWYCHLFPISPSIYYYNYNIFSSLMALLMMVMSIINCDVSDCIYLQFHCITWHSFSVLAVCVCIFQHVILMMPPLHSLCWGWG